MKLSEKMKNQIKAFEETVNIYHPEGNYRRGRVDAFQYMIKNIIKLEQQNESLKEEIIELEDTIRGWETAFEEK
jgi:hypothetical protein